MKNNNRQVCLAEEGQLKISRNDFQYMFESKIVKDILTNLIRMKISFSQSDLVAIETETHSEVDLISLSNSDNVYRKLSDVERRLLKEIVNRLKEKQKNEQKRTRA